MSSASPCPDDLISRARRESLSAAEVQRIEAHLSQCAQCSASQMVGRDFDRALASRPGDDKLVSAMALAVAAAMAKPIPIVRVKPARMPWRYALIAAAVTVLTAAIASGSIWAVRHFGLSRATISHHEQTIVSAHATPSRPVATAVAPTTEPVLPTEPTAPIVEPAVEPERTIAPAHLDAPRPSSNAISHTAGTPDQIFARATDARRRGEIDRAAALYHELQQTYPHSPEAQLSYVSLGRLLLDGRHDAHGAVTQFDRYLAPSADGSLAEEALFGRARALRMLERSADERATWELLLRRFPNSVYASRAHERIAAIR